MTPPYPLTVVQQILADVKLVNYSENPPQLVKNYRGTNHLQGESAPMVKTLENLVAGVMLEQSGCDPKGTEVARWSRILDGDLRMHKLNADQDTAANLSVDEEVKAILVKIHSACDLPVTAGRPARHSTSPVGHWAVRS